MKFISFSIVFVIGLLFVSSCTPKYQTVQGFAQGTTYSITYSDARERDFSVQFDSLLVEFDNSLSNYNQNSLLSKVNQGVDTVLDGWFMQCFSISKEIHPESDSLFDPTLRPLIAAWGFGAKQKAGFRELTQEQIDSVREFVGLDKVWVEDNRLVKADPRVTLDFNAIAQGLSVDVISYWLEEQGVENYLVEIGGEVFSRGVNSKGGKWRVGVDKPAEGNFTPGAQLETVIELQGEGLATSGNYRKFFDTPQGERVSHTIDPRTGRPVRHNLLSVTIVAPTAAIADAYATACMVGGLEWTRQFVLNHIELKAFVVYADENGEMVSEHL